MEEQDKTNWITPILHQQTYENREQKQTDLHM